MTTHVEKALPEPTMEPVPGATRASPVKPKHFNEDMLSPVSKLELARKYAADEQQRRVNDACERMVVVKKTQIVKKLEIEARLESHIQQKEQLHQTGAVKRGGRLSSIAMRLVDAFKATTDENDAGVANGQTNDNDSTSPTRQLLRATRNKLNSLVTKTDDVDGSNLPATNYHLKQLGLADDKINIYAPIHEQQSEIRRRRESAIRCQEKYMQENAEYSAADEGYKSADDSDYAPEDDDEDDGSDDEDASDVEVNADEVRGLIKDQSEFTYSIATLKRHKKMAKLANKAAKKSRSPMAILVAIGVSLLVVALAIFFAEIQSGSCRDLVARQPRAEEGRIVTCNVVLHIQAFFLRVIRLLTFQHE